MWPHCKRSSVSLILGSSSVLLMHSSPSVREGRVSADDAHGLVVCSGQPRRFPSIRQRAWRKWTGHTADIHCWRTTQNNWQRAKKANRNSVSLCTVVSTGVKQEISSQNGLLRVCSVLSILENYNRIFQDRKKRQHFLATAGYEFSSRHQYPRWFWHIFHTINGPGLGALWLI